MLISVGVVAEPAAIGRGLGLEGSGIITAVGSNITKHKVGDRVVLSRSGSLSSSVQILGRLCEKIPDDMTFEQAATLPVVYSTVIFGLLDKAGLTKGMVSSNHDGEGCDDTDDKIFEQSILIHSAAGGVGIAAIQIAQMVGAAVSPRLPGS